MEISVQYYTTVSVCVCVFIAHLRWSKMSQALMCT